MYMILSPRSVCLQLFTWSVHFPNNTEEDTNMECSKHTMSHWFTCTAYWHKKACTWIKYMTFALQESGHKFVECSWILEKCSHLVEIVWRHQNVLRVSHDVDYLRQLEIQKLDIGISRMPIQETDLGFGGVQGRRHEVIRKMRDHCPWSGQLIHNLC